MRIALAVASLLLTAGCLTPFADDRGDFVDPRTEQLRGMLWHGRTADIQVIVHAQPGYEPAATTIAAVEQEFARLSGKPVHVVVRREDYRFPDDTVWDHATLDAVRAPALAEAWPSGTALVHVFAIAGCYRYTDERPCIAAVAGTTATVFPRSEETGAPPNDPLLRDVPLGGWYHEERYLYVHELGHVFGLIDSPIDPVKARVADTDCLCHSDDTHSVMGLGARGWTVRLSPEDPAEILEVVEADNFEWYTFSEFDVEDIRAFQAGEPTRAG